MRALFINCMAVVSIFYVIIFLLCTYNDPAKVTGMYVVFVDYRIVVPCFAVAALSLIGLGKAFAHEEIEHKRYRVLKAMGDKQDELIEYIRLARLLTNKDADTLIEEFVARIDKENNISA